MPKPGNDDCEQNCEQGQKYVEQDEPVRFALEGEIPEALSHTARSGTQQAQRVVDLAGASGPHNRGEILEAAGNQH